MQLRKVCNHPNLFEPRPIVSPFQMESIIYYTASQVYGLLDYNPFEVFACLTRDRVKMYFLNVLFLLYLAYQSSHTKSDVARLGIHNDRLHRPPDPKISSTGKTNRRNR